MQAAERNKELSPERVLEGRMPPPAKRKSGGDDFGASAGRDFSQWSRKVREEPAER
jgi:hypothetical protein